MVGVPRSGTTMIYEALSARQDLAWFSRPLNRLPRYPVVTVLERLASLHSSLRSTMYRSDQIGPGLRRLRRLERLRLGPTEGTRVWGHWFGPRILYDYLLGAEASPAERERGRWIVAQLLRYQGKSRFVSKLAAPGHIHYLDSIFDDALFIHVIRDGRAVVHSLMNFPHWRDTFRLREPAWENGLSGDDLAAWRYSGAEPIALAAIQWRKVIETNRDEAATLAPGRYQEVRYEDFLSDPHGTLDELTEFSALEPAPEAHRFLDQRVVLRDMNVRWTQSFTPREIEIIEELIGPLLAELGYPPGRESQASKHDA